MRTRKRTRTRTITTRDREGEEGARSRKKILTENILSVILIRIIDRNI
jgi:hypothetical protein